MTGPWWWAQGWTPLMSEGQPRAALRGLPVQATVMACSGV